MAIRFTAYSVSVSGTRYTLYIDDKEGSAGSVDLAINGDGFSLAYDTEDGEDPMAPILSSTVEFGILATSETDFHVKEFISDLLTSDEDRFRLKITDADDNLFWAGIIIPDQVYLEDKKWADVAWEFRIKAVDGIGRLKDLDYNDDGTAYSGRFTIKDHLFNILNKTGTANIWGATDDYLYVFNRFYEANMNATVNVNPFDRTLIEHDVFIETDNEGNQKFKSCYEVLKQLLQLFLCRIYLSGGVWRIGQIPEYKETGSIYQHRYYSDGTKAGTTSGVDLIVEEEVDDAVRLEGTRFYWFAPLGRAILSFKSRNDHNYIPGAYWDENSDAAISTASFARSGIKLLFQANLKCWAEFANYQDVVPVNMWFFIYISVNIAGTTYYLKRLGTINLNGSISYQDAEWTTTFSYCLYIAKTQQYYNQVVYDQIVIETPGLPGAAETATAEIDVEFNQTTNIQSVIAPPTITETWEVYNSSLQLTSDNVSALVSEVEYRLDNEDTGNATVLAAYETLFADNEDFFTSASLTTYDGVADPEPSDSWTRGLTGIGVQIQTLFLRELMKIRKTTIKRLEGGVIGSSFQAWNILQLNDADRYILLRGKYNSRIDSWDGVWMKVSTSDTVTMATVGKKKIPLPLPPGPVPPPPQTDPWSNTQGIDSAYIGLTFDNGGQIATVGTGKITVGDTVNTIDINPIGVDNLIQTGDEIAVVDPFTGKTQKFTVAANVAAADTSISVTPEVSDFNFNETTFVTIPTNTLVDNIYAITRPLRYVEHFTMNGTDNSVTVTVNSGTLPASNDYLDVYYNGVMLQITTDYTVSGSVITFASWTPENGSRITIKFWI